MLTKKILRVYQALILAAGAPLGWFAIQWFFYGKGLADVGDNIGLYLYMWIGTSLSYTLFAAYVGHKEDKIIDLALHDPLSGLYNKRFFNQQLKHQTNLAHRSGMPLVLMLVDIDHFKQINDEHGHLIGDRVIQHLSKTLETFVRDSDVVARIGGEEFAVLLQPCLADGAFEIAERLRKEISSMPHQLKPETEVDYTISIGLALWEEKWHRNHDAYFTAADEALYHAKHHGRNKTTLYNQEHHVTAASKIA